MKTVQVTDKFKIYVSNEIEQWRADTFWTKEPETIEWIDSFYTPMPFTFIDVGSNIGMYSLYCASVGIERVISFEPVIDNYIRLCENIRLNNFCDILPLPIALSHRRGYEYFYYSEGFKTGQTATINGKDCNTNKKDLILFQALDDLLPESLDNIYIKIDTDGGERSILSGMEKTLNNRRVQGVLIEVNKYKEDIIGMMNYKGFTTDNRFNKLKNHSRVRRDKEGIKAENIIFTRRQT